MCTTVKVGLTESTPCSSHKLTYLDESRRLVTNKTQYAGEHRRREDECSGKCNRECLMLISPNHLSESGGFCGDETLSYY